MRNKSNYRAPFMDLMSDGEKRTVAEIKEALDMPETSNPNVFLNILKARLIYDRSPLKLRCETKSEKGRGLAKVWWIETKEAK